MNSIVRHANGSQLAKIGVSAFVLLTVFLQLHAGLLRMSCKVLITPLCRLPEDPELYPFVNYFMYSSAKQEGDAVGKDKLIVTFTDFSEQELTAQDLDLSEYRFIRDFVPSIKENDHRIVRQYTKTYEASHHRKIQSMRIEKSFVSVTREGLSTASPITIATLYLDSRRVEK